MTMKNRLCGTVISKDQLNKPRRMRNVLSTEEEEKFFEAMKNLGLTYQPSLTTRIWDFITEERYSVLSLWFNNFLLLLILYLLKLK